MITALAVTCPHCQSGPGEVCLGPAWPNKGLNSRRPLRFSVAHPARIAMAAAMSAGASGAQARQAAQIVVRSHQDDADVPYLDEASAAVDQLSSSSMIAYRKRFPTAEVFEPPQPELALE